MKSDIHERALQKAQQFKAQLEKEISKHTGYDKKKLTLDLPLETFEKLNRARDIASTKAAEYVSLETTIAKAIELYLFKNDPVEKAKRASECPPDPSTKTAVNHQRNLRDLGRCVFIYDNGSQCEEGKWLDAHHIIHRADGGPDTLENLVTLCKGHHRLMHMEH